MVERTTERTVVQASPASCWAVLVDVERYPDWAAGIKEVEVLARDRDDRATRVRFRAAGMGHSATYELAYDYRDAPSRLAWRQVDGDLTRTLDGFYELEPIEGAPDRTDVHYLLDAQLVVPLPAFVKRRAEVTIVHTALQDLKARVEQQART